MSIFFNSYSFLILYQQNRDFKKKTIIRVFPSESSSFSRLTQECPRTDNESETTLDKPNLLLNSDEDH
jgi:hypothetical protein